MVVNVSGMDASKVAVAVAGGAPISSTNLEDLLSDWLMIDTDEERAFQFFLPADSTMTTKVVTDTAEYLASIDAGYVAVASRSMGRRGGKIIFEDAESTITLTTDPLIDGLVKYLVHEKEKGFEPYLILAWGEDENGPDDETRELLSQALEAGIKVLDITAGLDDLSYDEEPEVVPTVAVQLELPELEPAPTPILRDEAQTTPPTPPTMAARDEERPVHDLATVLAMVYRHLDSLDCAEAARDMQMHMPSTLTLAVAHHLHIAVAAELAEASQAPESVAEATPEPVESQVPKTRGKPRDIATDMVKVLHDEAKQTIRVHPGKGRPRKGEESFEMLRSKYEAIKAQYELN